jgi:DNA invertase Pin-like site-specific DNA recombinase
MSVPAVCYYRMSTDAQEASIPAQRDWAHKAAPREGLCVVHEFEDPGVAGGEVEHRPGLQALLDYCERQFRQGTPVEAVLVWDPDRLSRASSLKTSAVLSRLQDSGVGRLLTASDGWVDLDDVTHRVLYLLKQDLARAGFCESLARNVLRGQLARATQGVWLASKPPLGYQIRAGRLEVDPRSAPLISWMFSAYASGVHTLSDLQAELQRRGVVPVHEARRRARGEPPRPIGWRVTTIRQILMNRAYLGHTVWNVTHRGRYARLQEGRVVKDDSARRREQDRRRRGNRTLGEERNPESSLVVVEHTHPPLTDAATFAAVQQRFVSNRRLTTPAKGGGVWVLSGLLRCGGCGSPMHGVTCTDRKLQTARRYYGCAVARCQRSSGRCRLTKLVPQDLLVREVVETVRERFAEGPALDALRAEVARLAEQGRAGLTAERDQLQARLAELEANIARGNTNLALLPADRIPGVVARVRKWEAERDEAARELGRLDAAAEARDDLAGKVDAALDGLRRLHQVIAAAKPAEARAALSAVLSRVTVQFRPAERTRDTQVAAVEVEMAEGLVKLFMTGSRPTPRRRAATRCGRSTVPRRPPLSCA